MRRTLAFAAAGLLLLTSCTSARQAGPSPNPAMTSGPPTSVSTMSTAGSSTSSAGTTEASSTAKTAPIGGKPAARKPAIRRPVPKPARTPIPAAVDPLTGGRPSGNPVVAVKIDNTFFEVAQFGVADADIVFVEQVEGGLTRLIAVFHTTLPNEVGPVRSVRSTDAQLLPVFGRPALVFAGGAGGPMAALATTPIIDTSTLTGAYFRSDLAWGTYNLHADLTKIAATASGLSRARYIGLNFTAQSARVAAGRPVSSIQVVMEAGVVNFSYLDGRFVRTRDGDQVSDYQGRSEVADNVLVQNIVDEPDGTVDTLGSPSYLSQTIGSGTVSLFRDGHEVAGTWKRARSTDPFVYADAKGKPLPFKPGKTWIVLAPQSAQLTVG